MEFLCFALFALSALYLVISRKYLSYVTPKMVPFLYFMATVMIVWAVSAFRRILRPVYRTHAAHCFVLLLPLIFLLIPHGQLNTSTVSSGYMSGTSIAPSAGNPKSASSTVSPVSSSPALGSSSPQSSAPAAVSGSSGKCGLTVSADGSISISDDAFYSALAEISSNLSEYEGKTITVKGYVYRDPSLMSSDEFVPARLLMYCCTADLTPCGFLCRYGNTSSLSANSWVTVTGTIYSEEINGSAQPVITASSVTPAEKPKDEYVYPW